VLDSHPGFGYVNALTTQPQHFRAKNKPLLKKYFAVLSECRFCIPAPCSAALLRSYHRKVISHLDGHSVFKVHMSKCPSLIWTKKPFCTPSSEKKVDKKFVLPLIWTKVAFCTPLFGEKIKSFHIFGIEMPNDTLFSRIFPKKSF